MAYLEDKATDKQLEFIQNLITNILDPLFDYQTTDDLIVGFINEKYEDWLFEPVSSLDELTKPDATEIIGRLTEGLD